VDEPEAVLWASVFADGPGGGNPCPVVLGDGLRPVARRRRGPELTDQWVLAALRLTASALGDGPIQPVSTARAKLMVPLCDEEVLDRLEPDLPLLWQVCDELDVTGFYPFSRTASGVAARQFPLRAGYPEDPATDIAACALGAYLTVRSGADPVPGWNRFSVRQGRAMGRPSRMLAETHVATDGTITATRVGGHLRPATR